jgi:hypothetical protein
MFDFIKMYTYRNFQISQCIFRAMPCAANPPALSTKAASVRATAAPRSALSKHYRVLRDVQQRELCSSRIEVGLKKEGAAAPLVCCGAAARQFRRARVLARLLRRARRTVGNALVRALAVHHDGTAMLADHAQGEAGARRLCVSVARRYDPEQRAGDQQQTAETQEVLTHYEPPYNCFAAIIATERLWEIASSLPNRAAQ